MEYFIEIITNGVLENVYKFDNRHEAIGAYMRLDSYYRSSLVTYVRYRRVR